MSSKPCLDGMLQNNGFCSGILDVCMYPILRRPRMLTRAGKHIPNAFIRRVESGAYAPVCETFRLLFPVILGLVFALVCEAAARIVSASNLS